MSDLKERLQGAVATFAEQELDNIVYFVLALCLLMLAGSGSLEPEGTKIADMLAGALLIKVKA